MSVSSLKLGLITCALAASSLGSAVAGPALSWNLSRDMFLSAKGLSQPQGVNPVGAWSFMHGPYPSLQLLSSFQSPCVGGATGDRCWRDGVSSPEPAIGIGEQSQLFNTVVVDAALPRLHPSPTTAAVARWTSPIKGPIKILGRFSDVDYGSFGPLGDGVTWRILLNGNTVSPLASGATKSTAITGDGDVFGAISVSVQIGDTIDFVVEAGPNSDHYYDSTELDVLITAQRKK